MKVLSVASWRLRKQMVIAVAALGAAQVLSTTANAATQGTPIIGFCSYLHENVTNYKSSVFQTNRADRDGWESDWQNYLIKSGIKFFGGAQCFGWKNSTIAFVEGERAKATPYIQNSFLDYVPDDTTPYGRATRQPVPHTGKAVAGSASGIEHQQSTPTPKYIEVAGPNGIIRLSPEVAARNNAAAEEYRRKMEAHARDKADHNRKLTEFEQSRANAAKALQDHQAKLRTQQEEHQRQLREHAARVKESDTPCARYRRSNGVGWKVNPCV